MNFDFKIIVNWFWGQTIIGIRKHYPMVNYIYYLIFISWCVISMVKTISMGRYMWNGKQLHCIYAKRKNVLPRF